MTEPTSKDARARDAVVPFAVAVAAWPLPAVVIDVEADEVVVENAAAAALLGPNPRAPSARRAADCVVEADRARWRDALAARAPGGAAPTRVVIAGAGLGTGAGRTAAADAHVARPFGPGDAHALVVLVPRAAAGDFASDAERAVAAAEARWLGRTRELEAVREEEQKRIARELHDRLGADLSLLRVELARVAPKLSWTRKDVRETIERMRDRAGELLETVRRISRELRPQVLDHVGEVGLAAVLEYVAAEVSRSTGFVVHLDAHWTPADDAAIDAARAEAAYHVVREALNNVVRHSGATRAVVTARRERGDAGARAGAGADALVVEVLDDGRGAASSSEAAEGIGWWSLRHRVAAFGGQIVVRAEPGVGTTVSARIPLAEGAPR